MNKLLSANFTRLLKSKAFWFGVVTMGVIGAWITLNHYFEGQNADYTSSLDNVLFGYASIVGITAAVFCSLFLGTEYSDGTLRNKLVVGHTRSTIYLSNLITCVLAALLMSLTYLVVVSALGIPLLEPIDSDLKLVLILLLDSIMMMVAFASILNTLGMLVQNKALSAVVCVIGAFVLLGLVIIIDSKLREPEFYSNYMYIDPFGNSSPGDPQPNPGFITGSARAVLEFFLDFVPSGQGFQITSMSVKHLYRLPVYSLIITAVTTVTGAAVFQKKDIK